MYQKLRRFTLIVTILFLVATAVFAEDFTADSLDQFFTTMEQAMENQLVDFTIQYSGDVADLTDQEILLSTMQRALATWQPASADSAQVVAYNLNDGDCALEDDTFYFTEITYLCTPEELAFVEQEAVGIVADLDLAEADELVKIKTIYTYVTENFVYDDTLTRFSAYEGLVEGSMVCQGYALLTSRLLWAADVPNTIMTGTSRSQNHAWNVVEYEGFWYLLDPTWDSADNTWNYFMESKDDFSGHYFAAAYETDVFEANHPLAEESLDLQEIAFMDGETRVGSLIIRLGISTQFEPGMPEGFEDADVAWSTGDEAMLTVDEAGTITAVGVGRTWLQVESETEPLIFPNRITVDVVDMTTLSDWSEDAIVEFYLNMMLPATLCSDYQSTLNRAELARLTSNFVEETTGLGSFQIKNLFEDMEGNSDIFNALRCSALNLMLGVSDTEFDPDSAVTRQEAVTVAMRLMERVCDEKYEADLTLVEGETDLANWAQESFAKALALGIVQGDEDGLRPLDLMTREEVYLMYSRVFSAYQLTLDDGES